MSLHAQKSHEERPSYSVQRQKHVKQYSMFSSLTPAAEGDADKTDVRIFIISQLPYCYVSFS